MTATSSEAKIVKTNQITLGERVVAGCLSALVMAIMTVCVPLGVLVLGRGRGLNLSVGVFNAFHAWGIGLIAVSGIAGALLGTDRITTILGHLWGTERSERPGVTLLLWAVVIGIGAVSYLMFGKHHG